MMVKVNSRIRKKYYVNIVKTYGSDILKSQIYKFGYLQKHHFRSNVSEHSISVALMSVRIGLLLQTLGVDFDIKSMVRGALLHDIGMIGRYSGKYKGIGKCSLFQHPLHSIHDSKYIVDNLSKKEVNIIDSHMWPFSFTMPCCVEAWTIVIADKLVTLGDICT